MFDELHDIFFYGLFMDERVLREKGVQPRNSRKAVVHGYELKIGRRAMLVPQPSSRAFGMVHALTESEISSLYSEPGLEMYCPETVVATFEDGSTSALTTFNLQNTSADEEPNIEYAGRLRSLLERLGLPLTITSTRRRSIGQSLSRCVFLAWTRSGSDVSSIVPPSIDTVVRRAQSFGKESTLRIFVITSTRIPEASA